MPTTFPAPKGPLSFKHHTWATRSPQIHAVVANLCCWDGCGRGGSLQNQAEASLAAALFHRLYHLLLKKGEEALKAGVAVPAPVGDCIHCVCPQSASQSACQSVDVRGASVCQSVCQSVSGCAWGLSLSVSLPVGQ